MKAIYSTHEVKYSILISFLTIIMREMKRIFRIWTQTFLPPIMTTTLYFLIFGTLIGKRIGQMDGYDYINFVVPGLVMMSIITNSYMNVVSSFFGAKFQKNIEEILVSPTPIPIIILGYVSGGVIRAMITGTLVFVIATFFSEFYLHNVYIVLSIALLAGLFFSLAGLTNAIYANSFDDITIVPTFVLTPLTYLGGVFYSIKVLPEFWQQVSLANPMLYLVSTFRYGILGIADISII